MTQPIDIPATEVGVVRVFRVTDPGLADRLRYAQDRGDETPAEALAAALGAVSVDPEFIDVIDVADLVPLRLSDYLAEGLGIAAEDFAPQDRARLVAAEGLVLIVLSAAVAGRSAGMRPVAGLTLLGTWHEDRPAVRFEPLPDQSAHATPDSAAPPAPPPRNSPGAFGVATVLLIIAVLIAAVIWLAA